MINIIDNAQAVLTSSVLRLERAGKFFSAVSAISGSVLTCSVSEFKKSNTTIYSQSSKSTIFLGPLNLGKNFRSAVTNPMLKNNFFFPGKDSF